MPKPVEPSLSEINAGIGRGYDALPYDPQANALVAPDRVLATAAIHGYSAVPRQQMDVLDLGCGTGSQLALAGDQVGGRLVGTDISNEACARARAKCARHGDRVTIRAADLLTLTPEDLGTFDLVTNIGVIFVVPAAVRSKILAMIGACLRPGGVAVIAYYAGSTPMMRSHLYTLLRDGTNPSDPIPVRAKAARQLLLSFRGKVPEKSRFRASLEDAISYAQRTPDNVFYHEVLSHTFVSFATSALAAEFKPHGLEFLDYAIPIDVGNLATSRQRLQAADLADFANGAYRYAIFGHPKGASQPPSVRTPAVKWTTTMQRQTAGNTLGGELAYGLPKSNGVLRSNRVPFQSMVERLFAGPLRWNELREHVHNDARAYDAPPPSDEQLATDLTYLWQRRFVEPRLADW